MNVELKNKNSENVKEINKVADTKEANTKRHQGDEEIKTSCISCKFKPNCEDAIPFYVQAADMYHGAHSYKDEIYCREKLVFCYRNLKSEWEEGNEHEKIAFVFLENLEEKEAAWKAIQNAFQCYFQKSEYKDAVNCVKKLGIIYMQKNHLVYAENCLRKAYDLFLLTFHTIATKKDEPHEFFYSAFDTFLSVLHSMKQYENAISACEKVLQVVEEYEENKNPIIHIYGFLFLTLIIIGDENTLKVKADPLKESCTKSSDRRFIENIEHLWESIKNVKENEFSDCMIEINVDYPIEVTKKLNDLFFDKKRSLNSRNSENEVFDEIVISDKNEENEEKQDYL